MNNSHEGLWAIEIGDKLGVISAGVIVFTQGKILGGNDVNYYAGTYNITDNKFSADVLVTHYNDIPSSLFGEAQDLPFTMSGIVSEMEIDLVGSLPSHSQTDYMVRLRKLHALQ